PIVAGLLVWRWARKPSTSQLRAALVVSAVVYAVGQLYRVYLLVELPSWARQGILWSPNWADFFAIGMATAAFSAAHAQGMRLPSALRVLCEPPAGLWRHAAV